MITCNEKQRTQQQGVTHPIANGSSAPWCSSLLVLLSVPLVAASTVRHSSAVHSNCSSGSIA
eukprot:21257-Heterococcus_DN1.PRE.1